MERIHRDFSSVFHYSPRRLRRGAAISFSHFTFQEDQAPLELEPRRPFLVIAPSASFEEKRWPLSSFKAFLELALKDPQLAPWQFAITAGPQDHFCSQFDPLCQRYPRRLFNLQGMTTLEESIQLVGEADFCLGNDTGILHFAESVGTPVLAILGPTGEQFGYYPHLPRSDTLSLSLWCRPCSTTGKGSCIRSQRFCLTHITPQMALERLKELLFKGKGLAAAGAPPC